MLIINGIASSFAVDWNCIESIQFDNKSELPNINLRITTRSGGAMSVLNPTKADGSDLSFKDIIKAKLDNFTCWEVSEGELK